MTINPVATWTFALAFVLAVGAGLIWLVKRWRDVDVDDGHASSEMLTKFRELHTRGGLSDKEYRTIKAKLAGQLQGDMGLTLEGLMPEELAAGELETGDRDPDEEDAGQGGS
ncbi:MAG: hypothetical protein KDA37_06440 [Planctomycetales bacterium]|nr:hypothetical protein [Planctomycetales bacterium]